VVVLDDVSVVNMRRTGPEPIAGAPQVVRKPGMADELLHELTPLLAEEGIDIADLATLQAAMDRAVERHNMQLFTPVDAARDSAAVVLREAAVAIGALAVGGALRAGVLRPVPRIPATARLSHRIAGDRQYLDRHNLVHRGRHRRLLGGMFTLLLPLIVMIRIGCRLGWKR
jgi:hypothetical protein